MNKKLFGIKISTYIQLLVCFVIAFCVWFFAKYADLSKSNETAAIAFSDLKYFGGYYELTSSGFYC